MTTQTHSLIQGASITGADDQTAIAGLQTLSTTFPFVEWALLYVPRAGGARNPSRAWRDEFFATPMQGSNAVHLCFKEPFEQLLKGELPSDLLVAKRLQLNINARAIDFTDREVLTVYKRALDLGPDVILQYQAATAAVVGEFLQSLGPADQRRVHVLLDESRGTGTAPSEWTLPTAVVETYVGFAGGLGPDNIATALERFDNFNVPYWVDMETRVRTDNQFDPVKVRAVLQAVNNHRSRPALA